MTGLMNTWNGEIIPIQSPRLFINSNLKYTERDCHEGKITEQFPYTEKKTLFICSLSSFARIEKVLQFSEMFQMVLDLTTYFVVNSRNKYIFYLHLVTKCLK